VIEIPGYEVIEQIGEGGMAVVWKAHQVSLDRIVAVKVLKKQFASDPDEVQDFITEARSAAKLKHPNIIQVYDAAAHNNTFYFVMEYVDGRSIGAILEERGPFPQKQALTIARCIADALHAAWDKANLVHRDIKPHNVMIDADGTVKVADLGLAKMVDPTHLSAQLHAGMIEGTPNYIAPEQAQCRVDVDCRTDMYSLGATLYHMLTGVMPFKGRSPTEAIELHTSGHLVNPRDINLSITVGAVQLITRLMMKEPDDRYADWPAAIDAIKKTAAGRLLIGQQQTVSTSTVAKASGQTAAQTPARKKTSTAPLPAPVRLLIWVLILAWWVFVAYNAFKQPAAAPPPPEPEPAQVTPEPAPATPSEKPVKSAAVPIAVIPDVVVEEEQPEVGLGMLKTTVAEHVLAEEFGTAVALIDRELQYPHTRAAQAEMESLRSFIEKISTMESTIESAFKRRIGMETTVHHGGKDRKIVIQKVEDGAINGLVVSQDGSSRPVDFSLSQLEPRELSRWLGNPRTQSRHAQQFILHMMAQDYEKAVELAENCGPLSDTFKRIAESRR